MQMPKWDRLTKKRITNLLGMQLVRRLFRARNGLRFQLRLSRCRSMTVEVFRAGKLAESTAIARGWRDFIVYLSVSGCIREARWSNVQRQAYRRFFSFAKDHVFSSSHSALLIPSSFHSVDPSVMFTEWTGSVPSRYINLEHFGILSLISMNFVLAFKTK